MFLGHFAVGFAVKKAVPHVSLGTLFLAAMLLDCVWPVLVLTGIERVAIVPGNTAVTPLQFVSYPYSHSLLMAIAWAVLAGVLYSMRRNTGNAALWIAVAVVSHWVLDAVTHRPDLPLYSGSSELIGFGLWNSMAATIAIEGAMFVGALALYLSMTHANDNVGHYSLWSLVALMVLAYVMSIFGPPPPGVQAVAIACILGAALAIAGGYWIDRHRTVTQPSIPSFQT